jgi:hypothetical protein
MNTVFEPEAGVAWPRNQGAYNGRWLHSDMNDVAFFYTHKLFKMITEEGDLK